MQKQQVNINEYNDFIIKNVIGDSKDYTRSETILEDLIPVVINDLTKENIMDILKIFDDNQYSNLGG